MKKLLILSIAVCAFFLIVSPSAAQSSDTVALVTAREMIPEELLLDVGIRLFDPGLADYVYADEEDGIFPEVRRGEARYIPVRIMETLQSTGFWGAVRVVPNQALADLTISGTILESNGLVLDLRVVVTDATGRVWMEERYKAKADERAYNDRFEGVQPFQSLYHELANDLLKKYQKRDERDLLEVRRVAQLQFAEDLAPDAFSGYLDRDRKGRLEAERLPAQDDPMWLRVSDLRERELLFVDVFTQHYTTFFAKMDENYQQWRQYSYEEMKAFRKLKRQARTRKILGIASLIGAIVAAEEGGRNSGAVTDIAVIGGVMAISSGMTKGQEAKMHKESIRELTASLDTEMSPMLVDVEGELLRLTGSVEEQYEAWRSLLRQIFAVETTGTAPDPNILSN